MVKTEIQFILAGGKVPLRKMVHFAFISGVLRRFSKELLYKPPAVLRVCGMVEVWTAMALSSATKTRTLQ